MQKVQGEDRYKFLIRSSTTSALSYLGPAVAVVDGGPEGVDSYHGFPFHTSVSTPWVSTEPKLTVPDLADSIGAMLARRTAGVEDAPTTLMMRSYPTDPATIRTAQDTLRDLTLAAKADLEKDKKAIVAHRRTKKAEAEKVAAEQKAFAEFQANQKKLITP